MKKPVRNARIPQAARQPQTASMIRQADTASRRMARVLAQMARDGDIETVAEILEEMSDPCWKLSSCLCQMRSSAPSCAIA